MAPLRRNQRAPAERCETSLSRGLRMIDLDGALLRTAAEIRAATGARTPDALQLAGAVAAGCTRFVTNDRRVPTLPGLEVLQLADFA
ncbi:MAG TPA: PIN domain-containing protein [Thermoanaerobaculia bacterium]|nr:PIN domain-containing protein [Thermoanaerobaculia bacterium]